MTITRKIEKDEIEKMIAKGGSVSSDAIPNKKTQVNVVMKKSFLELIDEKVKKREGLCRNAWILEALQEKLKREDPC